MKISQSKKSIATFALLVLLSLNAIAGITVIVNAAPVKDPTVFISGNGSIELIWKSGKTQVYSADAYANLGGLVFVTITPSNGWHIETILFDENLQTILDEDGFTLTDSLAKKTISVDFVENGGVDDVDTGVNAAAYPDPDVGLIFTEVLTEGYAYAFTTPLPLSEQIGNSWDIQTDATFDPNIIIYLVINLADLPDGVDPNDLALWRTEVVLGDVNLDGIVDGEDQSIIANANPDPTANPEYDLNGDGIIDDEDVNICAHNHGLESVWVQLESWVIVENGLVYVYGISEHLSIYGVTRKW